MTGFSTDGWQDRYQPDIVLKRAKSKYSNTKGKRRKNPGNRLSKNKQMKVISLT